MGCQIDKCADKKGFMNFVKGLMCESDGTPSSTRVLMYIFSFFTIWVLGFIIRHIFYLEDVNKLTIWLSNLPLLIAALIGLISLPYTINRGATSMSDIANMIAQVKAAKANGNGNGNGSPDHDHDAPAATPPATGSAGPKG